jgi:hypothetical protein
MGAPRRAPTSLRRPGCRPAARCRAQAPRAARPDSAETTGKGPSRPDPSSSPLERGRRPSGEKLTSTRWCLRTARSGSPCARGPALPAPGAEPRGRRRRTRSGHSGDHRPPPAPRRPASTTTVRLPARAEGRCGVDLDGLALAQQLHVSAELDRRPASGERAECGAQPEQPAHHDCDGRPAGERVGGHAERQDRGEDRDRGQRGGHPGFPPVSRPRPEGQQCSGGAEPQRGGDQIEGPGDGHTPRQGIGRASCGLSHSAEKHPDRCSTL